MPSIRRCWGAAICSRTQGRSLHKIDRIAKLVGTRRFIPSAEPFSETWIIARRERLVAIGASAGGSGCAPPRSCPHCPRTFPAAVVGRAARGPAVRAGDGGVAEPRFCIAGARGQGWRSPDGRQRVARRDQRSFEVHIQERVGYTSEPRELAYRPSVDVFFNSVGAQWPGEAVGVLLTGMGRDGAEGLKALRDRGHYTIAQDQATSTVLRHAEGRRQFGRCRGYSAARAHRSAAG